MNGKLALLILGVVVVLLSMALVDKPAFECDMTPPKNRYQKRYKDTAECLAQLSSEEKIGVPNPNCENTKIIIYAEYHDQDTRDEEYQMRKKAKNGDYFLALESYAFDEQQTDDNVFGINGEHSWVINTIMIDYATNSNEGIQSMVVGSRNSRSRKLTHIADAEKNCQPKNDDAFSDCMLDYYINISNISEQTLHEIMCLGTHPITYRKTFLENYSHGWREDEMAQNIKQIFDQWACPNHKDLYVIVGATHGGLLDKLPALGVQAPIHFIAKQPFVPNTEKFISHMCHGEIL